MTADIRGFGLVEVMVAMLVSMVALLALGAFTLSMLDQGELARERIAAVHLAESLLEEWQADANDNFPSLRSDCSSAAAQNASSYPLTSSCISPLVHVTFNIEANEQGLSAPMPGATPALAALTGVAGLTLVPKVKTVKVSWYHKKTGNASKDAGRLHSVFLLHVSEVK
ncbi:MAG: hypothetical protein D6678_02190 [Zetaproteobacteria bacterium]|nr:MAG: hypothetical protein D6678_02190 [Zetaproteobacteria bacterium]